VVTNLLDKHLKDKLEKTAAAHQDVIAVLRDEIEKIENAH
jgi:hypothetical protein